ncbi:hypothetical protein ACIPRD_31550 [Streptomyces sp. NPDC090108]|uniref:hypothetical protein n=1 Tax=Streptomyces sp. NPDC090108 TaxID=3365947 RepID=UPI00380A8F53
MIQSLISRLQGTGGTAAVAAQGAGDTSDGQQALGLALVAAMQAAAPAQSGHGPFDHAPMPAQAAGRFNATAGDAGHDLPSPQPAPLVVEDIALVRGQLGRATTAWATVGADRQDTVVDDPLGRGLRDAEQWG